MNRYYLPRLIATAALTILALLLMAAASSVILSGCRAARPAPTELPAPQHPVLTGPDTVAAVRARSAPGPPELSTGSGPGQHRARPAFFLSTAAGSARRQARKDARAAVPRRLGKGAVYAPKAAEVVNAYKSKAPVVLADSAAVVTVIGKNKAPVAAGENATATQTTTRPLIAWWWWLIAVAAAVLWFIRKSIPFLG